MNKITISDNEKFVTGFIGEYLADGMGAMPKREFDILVMNLFLKYGGIEGMSNQELSILLQTPEYVIKRLRYEALLKYPPNENYVQKEFLIVLSRSQFELDKKDGSNIDKMKIIFVMEDDFLRHEIQGRLKAKGMFADTSFNSEIIKIECSSLVAVIREIYGEKIAKNFYNLFKTLNKSATDEDKTEIFRDSLLQFILDTAKSIFNAILIAEVKTRLGM